MYFDLYSSVTTIQEVVLYSGLLIIWKLLNLWDYFDKWNVFNFFINFERSSRSLISFMNLLRFLYTFLKIYIQTLDQLYLSELSRSNKLLSNQCFLHLPRLSLIQFFFQFQKLFIKFYTRLILGWSCQEQLWQLLCVWGLRRLVLFLSWRVCLPVV